MNDSQTISADLQVELNKAQKLLVSGTRLNAIAHLRAMLGLQATGAFWGKIALMLMRASDFDSALVGARRFVADCPDSIEAMSLLANLLANIGWVDEAIPLATEVCKRLPQNPAAHYNLGIYLSRDGQTQRAIQSFREALSMDPNHALSLEYLANLDPGETTGTVSDQIEICLSRNQTGDYAIRSALHYGKAVLLDRQQAWEQAFVAYETGARLMKNVARTDLAAAERYVSGIKESFTANFFKANTELRYTNNRPVFIVGMPRSGTTLVESVFASHSKVKAGGETKLLGLATMQGGGFQPRDLARIHDDIRQGKNPWANMGGELRRLQEQRYGTNTRMTEKNLGHHFHLGVIAMIASGARIIYCTRKPIATAWSCYKIRFSNGNGWSYDFESIGRYQRLYRDLMSHWQQVLPDAPIFEIAYEDLVTRPAEMIPKMLAHAKLEVEPGCLTPHLAKMPVMTASVTQVREPIHTAPIDAWRHYESQLGPYMKELESSGGSGG